MNIDLLNRIDDEELKRIITDGNNLASDNEKLDMSCVELLLLMEIFDRERKNHGTRSALFDIAGAFYYLGLARGYRNGIKAR